MKSSYLILEKIGFRMKRIGTTYLLDTIDMIKDFKIEEVMMNKYVYIELACKYKTSEKAIESNMREAIVQTYNNIQFKEIKEQFFRDKVPSNKEMVLFLREYIEECKNESNNDIINEK